MLSSFGTSFASVIRDPVPIDRRDAREVSLFVAYAQHAALQALHQAGLLQFDNPKALAVIMGTGIGALEDIGDAQVQLDKLVSHFS